MSANSMILVVCGSAPNFEALRLSFDSRGVTRELRRVSTVPMAIARVAGGGVSTIVADCSEGASGELTPGLLAELREGAAGLPVIPWIGDSAVLAGEFAQAAAGLVSLSTYTPASELKLVLNESARYQAAKEGAGSKGHSKSTLIAVMGAKGGVGTSTVAMNIAAGLAARGEVILAEMRSTLGSLEGHFHAGRMVRGLPSLLENAHLPSLLWPAPNPPGLRILFAPQSLAECREIDAALAGEVLDRLGEEAEFVVLDLPVALETASQAILARSHYMALVIEPTSTCVRLGRTILAGIRDWERVPASIGAVLVKRRPEGPSLGALHVEKELGVPLLKVIPPAPESCMASEEAHLPLVEFDPECLAAGSLVALSTCFHPRQALRATR